MTDVKTLSKRFRELLWDLGEEALPVATAKDIQQFNAAAGDRLPEAFFDLYRIAGNGGRAFAGLDWYALAAIPAQKEPFDESEDNHPDWNRRWFPFLGNDFLVVCVEAASDSPTSGAVFIYDYKGGGPSPHAESFDAWLQTAVTFLEGLVARRAGMEEDAFLDAFNDEALLWELHELTSVNLPPKA